MGVEDLAEDLRECLSYPRLKLDRFEVDVAAGILECFLSSESLLSCVVREHTGMSFNLSEGKAILLAQALHTYLLQSWHKTAQLNNPNLTNPQMKQVLPFSYSFLRSGGKSISSNSAFVSWDLMWETRVILIMILSSYLILPPSKILTLLP